jgi:hypothetical protein
MNRHKSHFKPHCIGLTLKPTFDGCWRFHYPWRRRVLVRAKQTGSRDAQKPHPWPPMGSYQQNHVRMARGGHALPKVSPRPAMPNPSTPCGWATPETTFQPFQGWPASRAGNLRPSSTLLDTPRRTPIIESSICRIISKSICFLSNRLLSKAHISFVLFRLHGYCFVAVYVAFSF